MGAWGIGLFVELRRDTGRRNVAYWQKLRQCLGLEPN